MLQTGSNITIKLQSAERGKIMFRVRRVLPLGKLKEAYCLQMGLDKSLASLCFDGERIMDDDTANSLMLEDGDLVDVMMEQSPGRLGDAAA